MSLPALKPSTRVVQYHPIVSPLLLLPHKCHHTIWKALVEAKTLRSAMQAKMPIGHEGHAGRAHDPTNADLDAFRTSITAAVVKLGGSATYVTNHRSFVGSSVWLEVR
jgi:hypothetical protein